MASNHQKKLFFFLNTAEDKGKKPSPTKPVVNGLPGKHKTLDGKVLRNKTRSAIQEEVLQTTAAMIKEHQTDLHAAANRRSWQVLGRGRWAW